MISYYVSIQSQIGVPDIGLTLNSETISTNIRDYGNVTRTVADRVRLKPRMHHLFNNGKDNMVRVPFTLQHALNGTVNGVDHDLVTGVAVEWLQIDQIRSDDDIKEDEDSDDDQYDAAQIKEEVDAYLASNDVSASSKKKWSSKTFALNNLSAESSSFDHVFDTRRQGLFLVRIKLLGIHKDHFAVSEMQFIKIFRMRFYNISDSWDAKVCC